jgi:murein DD-endopeptidase MepM/ murein hydrolase activator NlpD
MRFRVGFMRSAAWLRAAALTLIAVAVAGCSVESGRFGEQAPRTSQSEVTGSIPSGQSAPAPVGRVESQPLPQVSQVPTPPQPAPVVSQVVAGGGRGMASYTPPPAPYAPAPQVTPVSYGSAPTAVAYNPRPAAYNPPPAPVPYIPPPPAPVPYDPPSAPPTYNTASYRSTPVPAPAPDVTGSVVAPSSVVRKPAPSGQWSWDGGTAITVAPGDTVDSIARRHGVPVAAVMEANHLASANSIQAGQRLVIPRYIPPLATASAAPVPPAIHTAPPVASAPPPPAPKPAPPLTMMPNPPPPSLTANAASSTVHVVAPGDTLTKIARQYGKSVAEVARANNIQSYGKLSVGDRIVIPGVRINNANAKPDAEHVAVTPAPSAPKVVTNTPPAGPTQSASMVAPAAETPATDTAAKAAADTTPGFRWPARGRVIAGFGPKPNGQQNDGIDVAVPENTPIKAAEDGVVAYAGSELKGYGNLILVKHPNGYVTAYAHAKELLVKRGDPIKRGEVIAKSGQTGNVDVPELHFEVRKGTVPVDPMPFLNGV